MAKFAVQAYAARNQVCHGEAGHLVTAEKWDDLAQRISLDPEALPEILPEGRGTIFNQGFPYARRNSKKCR